MYTAVCIPKRLANTAFALQVGIYEYVPHIFMHEYLHKIKLHVTLMLNNSVNHVKSLLPKMSANIASIKLHLHNLILHNLKFLNLGLKHIYINCQ